MGAWAASWDCRGARVEGGSSHKNADQEKSTPKDMSLNQAEMLLPTSPRVSARTYPRGNRRDPRTRGPSLSSTSMHQRGNHHCTWEERHQLQPQPSHSGRGKGMEPAWDGSKEGLGTLSLFLGCSFLP